MTTYKYPPNTQVAPITEADARDLIRRGADFATTSATGGQQMRTYWTPDGRRLVLVPQMRHFIKKDSQGNVVAQGERDANLDKGYLTQPPPDSEKKVFCKWCGWHDTQVEVEACNKRNEQLAIQRENSAEVRQARLEAQKSVQVLNKDKEIADLKKQLDDLTKLVKEKLSGQVL